MKLNIALCDDDMRALPIISGAVESTFHAKGIKTELSRFTSGKALLKALETNSYNLLLLDIEMPGMDGIALGKRIRAQKNDTKIVFVSEAESRVFESFLVQPLGFVRKSNFLNDINAVVDLYLKTIEQEKTTNYLDFNTRSGILTLKSRQIIYIESSRNYQLLNIEGKSQPIEIKMTMEKLEEMTVPYGFIRIHKGFLVNYEHIQHLSSTAATLRDGRELPIGRTKATEVKMKYLNLIGH